MRLFLRQAFLVTLSVLVSLPPSWSSGGTGTRHTPHLRFFTSECIIPPDLMFLASRFFGPFHPQTTQQEAARTSSRTSSLRRRLSWLLLRGVLRHAGISSFHRHTSGSLSAEKLAALYAENEAARIGFSRLRSLQDHFGPDLDPTEPDHLRRIMTFKNSGMKGLHRGFEPAFIPGKNLLLHDDEQFSFTRRWYKELLLDAHSQGHRWTGVRSTFDTHNSDPMILRRSIETAVEGLLEGEATCRGETKGVLFLALRKSYSAEHAAWLLKTWLELRDEWKTSRPEYASKLAAVDSVMSEHFFDPIAHRDVFRDAYQSGQVIAFHTGEEWNAGGLRKALGRIHDVLDSNSGVPVTFLTNPLALFVDIQSLPDNLYKGQKHVLENIQARLLEHIRHQDIILEISPLSNESVSAALREEEGWHFHRLDSPIYKGIRVVVTDDDPGLTGASLEEEYRRLYFGDTCYGPVSLSTWIRLVLNNRSAGQVFDALDKRASAIQRGLESFSEFQEKINLKRLQKERLLAHELPGGPRLVAYGSARIPKGALEYAKAKEAGAMAFQRGWGVSSGAGPGPAMEGFLEGYIEARQRAGIPRDGDNETMGIRIELPFEQGTNPSAEKTFDFFHFVTRKTALHEQARGLIAFEGGFGTVDEVFESLRRDQPVVLLNKEFWGPLMQDFEKMIEVEGIQNQIRTRPFVTDSIEDAFTYIDAAFKSRAPKRSSREKINLGNRELEEGLKRLEELPAAITFVGKPHPQSNSLDVIRDIMISTYRSGQTVRVASRGPLFETAQSAAQSTGLRHSLQAVLYLSSKDAPLSEGEKGTSLVSTVADSVHQILLTKKAKAFVFTYGGYGTFNKLWDVLTMMQTGKMARRPLLFIGGPTASDFFNRIFYQGLRFLSTFIGPDGQLEKRATPLISGGSDDSLLSVVNSADEALAILGIPRPDPRTLRAA